MVKNIRLTLILMCLPLLLIAQNTKPGIGLALAGGGAKGLAHIGILKAIDSAELNINYITGTSMGSIVGGLYAAGYSGDSIEYIARNIDWSVLLSNSIPMTNYIMEEKGEYGKYAVELPVNKNKVSLPSGFLESQELWLTLEKYYFPVASIENFDKLSIPYRCLGTDLATGDAVVFSGGCLARAIRASMAIPGAFSPVDIDGKRFVDGGVTRNFPVKDLKDLGANYTIGISVSTPLNNVEELDDALKVLSQVMFLNENKDFIEESALADLLIKIPMGTYTSASFDDGNAIIDLGIEQGRKYYPLFKKLADSLKLVYPDYRFTKNRLPEQTGYKFAKVEVIGLKKKEKEAFLNQINLDTSMLITCGKLEKETREAFAYRMYKSIVYEIKQEENGDYKLLYRVKPESAVMLKAGVIANTTAEFGVQVNLTGRNVFTPFSRSLVSLNIGQHFRGLLEHLQMFGYKKPWSNRFQVYSEMQELPTYTDFESTGLYKLKYFTIDDRFQLSAKRRSAGGIGVQWENIVAKPQVKSGTYYDGQSNYFHIYGFWQYNTLSKPLYPKKGTQLEIKAGYVFDVKPDIEIYEDGVLIAEITKSYIQYGSYLRTTMNFSNTTSLNKRWAWISRAQGGVNFTANQSFLNSFIAGGMAPIMRNQVMFAGLREGEVVSESMISAHIGPRYNPFGKMYITITGSTLFYDFIEKDKEILDAKWMFGAGMTFAYDLPIGPLEFSLMWNNKNGGLGTYLNLGFPFKL
ncbi:MAG TPA: patatin-like phospholipase family protein [Chitinophagaceae bacterium]|nr:patatin-like phospholipase family protein [Chitinophagaceae bacterium]